MAPDQFGNGQHLSTMGRWTNHQMAVSRNSKILQFIHKMEVFQSNISQFWQYDLNFRLKELVLY